MKPTRSAYVLEKPSAPPAGGLVGSWVRFWFTPVDPVGLHAVRLLAGLLFLAWLLPLAGNLDSLFGLQGWFDEKAYVEAGKLRDNPFRPAGWSALYLCGSNSARLATAYWVSIGVLALFTLGLWPRVTAVLTWLVVASFTANPALEPNADVFLLILSFYLMIGYLLLGQGGTHRSLMSRLLGTSTLWPFRRSETDGPQWSRGANLALRLLQVHVAIVLVTMGLHKLQSSEWWAGFAFWYPLHPAFETSLAQARKFADPKQREPYLTVLSLAAYLTLAWQIGFPLFAWRPRWRPVLLGGAALGWLATAFLFKLPLVGPALFIGCLSYVTPAEWHRLIGWLSRVPGLHRPAQWLLVLPDGPAAPARKEELTPSLVTVGER